MPAVTVDDLLVLPRVPVPGEAAVERKVTSVTTAPSGFEGEGFPVRRAFAGVDLQRSTRSSTWTRWARSSTRRASRRARRGTRTAASRPSPTCIDGDVPAPGLQRRRRPDHQRRHPVDDRRQRPAAHRGAAGGPGRQSGGLFHGFQLWVNLPAKLKMAAPRYQDIRAGQVSLLSLARRRRAAARHRRRRGRPSAGRASRTRRSRWCTPRFAPGAQLRLPWRPDFNALVYTLGGQGHRRRQAAAGRGSASSPSSAAGDVITIEADARRRAAARAWTC